MASRASKNHLCLGLSLVILLPLAVGQACTSTTLTHHGGRLLTGNLNIGIAWYGDIKRAQKKAILSFLRSLNQDDPHQQPQVSSWWEIVESYQKFAGLADASKINVKVVNRYSDPDFTYGKVMIKDYVKELIPKATGGKPNTLALIVASNGVTLLDMCAGSCAQHGVIDETPYVAVGDPEQECPECAWPLLNKPTEPQGVTMKPPSGNVGADSMVMLLAAGLAGAVTNPYGDGVYAKGHGDDPIEATTMCPGIFATGASPGNPGKLPVDAKHGGAYNAHGDGMTFLLPALWNPESSSCWTPL